MPRLVLRAVVATAFLGLAFGLPALDKRQSITALSSAQISAFKPFTFFASAAYCQPTATINWSCGGMSYNTPT